MLILLLAVIVMLWLVLFAWVVRDECRKLAGEMKRNDGDC